MVFLLYESHLDKWEEEGGFLLVVPYITGEGQNNIAGVLCVLTALFPFYFTGFQPLFSEDTYKELVE